MSTITFLCIIAILLFALLSPNIVMLLHSRHFSWKTKKEKIAEQFSDTYIEFRPIINKYSPVYKGQYPYKSYGHWDLFSHPNSSTLFSLEKDALAHLNEFLEWKGKDIVKIPIVT